MAAVTLTPDDLAPFAVIDESKALVMIEDAMALAARVAPCILEEDFAFAGAAKAIIRGAILRWNEAGAGAVTTQQAGPFMGTIDTKPARKGMFWPSEIGDLQGLCSTVANSGAFTVDTLGCGSMHSEICSLVFGANYCSCGADIAGFPLYEVTP